MSILSVTQLVAHMKRALEFEVGEVWVEGEVSNLRRQSSGHLYFSIKDENAQLPCVLFKGRAKATSRHVEEGHRLQLFGELTVYEVQGRAQLLVSKVKVAGEGDLQARFEQLKRTLDAEGLFAASHKKPLPSFPQRIALITSPSGAALQDMRSVLSRRAPWIELYLYPVTVQGKGAEIGIAQALNALAQPAEHGLPEVDTIIAGRGGGSIEDLWNFNEEIVARALFACPIPTISAVGHEIDFTIADFVADQRAATPSAAAELAVPDRADLLRVLSNRRKQLHHSLAQRIALLAQELTYLSERLGLMAPRRVLEQREELLEQWRVRLPQLVHSNLERQENILAQAKARLAAGAPDRRLAEAESFLAQARQALASSSEQRWQALRAEVRRYRDILRTLGPQSTLARGYSITLHADGSPLRSAEQAQQGDPLTTLLHDGKLHSLVVEKKAAPAPSVLSSDDT